VILGRFPGVGDREPEARETSETRPFVTIRAGGPLEGVVTITAIEGES